MRDQFVTLQDIANAFEDKDRQIAELKRELEALKAAPRGLEREVDRELRAKLDAWLQCGRMKDEATLAALRDAAVCWLAAPLDAAPAMDEYTKAAVTYAETMASCDPGTGLSLQMDSWCCFRDLYEARKRGEPASTTDHRNDALAYALFDPAKHVKPLTKLALRGMFAPVEGGAS